jgi:hypothetical protein
LPLTKDIPVTINQLNSSVKYPNKTISSFTSSHPVKKEYPHNSLLEVKLPYSIDVADGIRQKFVSWSDGNTSLTRKLLLSKNYELYPIYEIQYLLAINSTCQSNIKCGNPRGGEWYDVGTVAHFSIDSPALETLYSQSFDYWSSNVILDPIHSASTDGSFRMYGPIFLNANWKWDYNYQLGILTFVVSGFGLYQAIGRLKNKKHKINWDDWKKEMS